MPAKSNVEQLAETFFRVCDDEEVEAEDVIGNAVKFFQVWNERRDPTAPAVNSLKEESSDDPLVHFAAPNETIVTVDINGRRKDVLVSSLYPPLSKIGQV